MGAELDADADTDDEIDEGDGVEGDGEQGHAADHVDDNHGYCNGYD